MLKKEKYCCSACMAEFDTFVSPVASEQMMRHTIASRFGATFHFEKGWCRYLFHKKSSLQVALHAMKYERLFNLGIIFGRQLGEWMLSDGNIEDIECIVPVPLHPLKKIERSYNQSEKIAEGIGQALRKSVRSDLLVRKKYTRSQTGLTAEDRKKNMDSAFQVTQGIMLRHVLLVDDVLTTGATMASATLAFHKEKVERVSLATLALAARE